VCIGSSAVATSSLSITVAGASVEPVSVVRDLGVYIDSELGAATHVSRTVSRCFAALQQLRHLRRYVTNDCFRSLVVSLVHSRLDYGNFVFVGLPVYLQRRLQAILNAAARLVFGLRRYDHVTDALAILHWLRVPERVNFKLALMAYRVPNGMAPSYLNQLVLSPCSCSSRHTVCQQSAVARFRLQPLRSETLCQMTFSLLHLFLPPVDF